MSPRPEKEAIGRHPIWGWDSVWAAEWHAPVALATKSKTEPTMSRNFILAERGVVERGEA
jgi:hypothetical protein